MPDHLARPKILSQEQAQSVYSAMLALKAVGGLLETTIYETHGTVTRVKQNEESGLVYVWQRAEDWAGRGIGHTEQECYDNQEAFAKAYSLI